MSKSTHETRRAFLVLLARTAVFVPPALASLSVDRLGASVTQGKGGGTNTNSGNGKGAGTDGNTGNGAGNSIGSLSASGQQVQTTGFRTRGQAADQTAPWNPGTSGAAPWSRPPPSSTGN